jgi:hypothetical protein
MFNNSEFSFKSDLLEIEFMQAKRSSESEFGSLNFDMELVNKKLVGTSSETLKSITFSEVIFLIWFISSSFISCSFFSAFFSDSEAYFL